MRISFALLGLSLLFLAACNNGTNSHTNSTQPVSGFASHQFNGLFSDTIPCADCAGIITCLDLEPDSTFILEQEYVGLKEGDRVFYQLGRWSLVDSLLRLNEITEGPRQFKIISTNELKMLDNEGAIITGTNLNFSLHRKSTPFVARKNITVRGMAIDSGTHSFIKICAWGKDVPLEITAHTQFADSITGLKNALKTRVLTEVEGNFKDVKDLNGKTERIFSAAKFLKYLPAEKCRE